MQKDQQKPPVRGKLFKALSSVVGGEKIFLYKQLVTEFPLKKEAKKDLTYILNTIKDYYYHIAKSPSNILAAAFDVVAKKHLDDPPSQREIAQVIGAKRRTINVHARKIREIIEFDRKKKGLKGFDTTDDAKGRRGGEQDA